ncbi:hypothetical protein [Rhizobium sp. SSA_523]|uniref:hypothetical protein n=1 Tax=Rhizobium sp. SSA_523 TaxID=2952477 RepID=UPI0020909D03|nr:hypothetical protein [Rhizobium sp. SSA_523]MCO5734091.1 hypothetical protein [Rhizobium sp. SSA_523]WKC24729.1 hypothetical protein QTJ18_11930 [Rhizobium sp. SSA_523]
MIHSQTSTASGNMSPFAAATTDHTRCVHIGAVEGIKAIAAAGSKGPIEVVYLYVGPAPSALQSKRAEEKKSPPGRRAVENKWTIFAGKHPDADFVPADHAPQTYVDWVKVAKAAGEHGAPLTAGAAAKLSVFLEALSEWGCISNDERAVEILKFQQSGYDLSAYEEGR